MIKMRKINLIDILRGIEIIVDVIMIGIYYATDTFFSNENLRDNAKNHYGQFVLIGGLIFAIVMLCSCIALDIYKRYPYVVLYYNVIWFAMYMAAGVIVLNMWEGSLVKLNNRKGGGIAVGTFCLINCGVLLISSLIILKDS